MSDDGNPFAAPSAPDAIGSPLAPELKTSELSLAEAAALAARVWVRRFPVYFALAVLVQVPHSVSDLFFVERSRILEALLPVLFAFTEPLWQGAVLVDTEAILEGRAPDLKHALARSLRCFLWSVLGTILVLFVVLAFSLLLVIPGFVALVACSFFLPALVLRGQKGLASLRYSRNLVEGRWWRLAGFNLFSALGSSAFSQVLLLGANTLPELYRDEARWAAGLIPLSLAVFMQILLAVLFVNLDSQTPEG